MSGLRRRCRGGHGAPTANDWTSHFLTDKLQKVRTAPTGVGRQPSLYIFLLLIFPPLISLLLFVLPVSIHSFSPFSPTTVGAAGLVVVYLSYPRYSQRARRIRRARYGLISSCSPTFVLLSGFPSVYFWLFHSFTLPLKLDYSVNPTKDGL